MPRGLPGAQIIFGLPEGRTELFLRDGMPRTTGQGLVPKEMRVEWWFLSTTLGVARRHWV